MQALPEVKLPRSTLKRETFATNVPPAALVLLPGNGKQSIKVCHDRHLCVPTSKDRSIGGGLRAKVNGKQFELTLPCSDGVGQRV